MKKLGLDIDGTVTCPTTFVPYLNEKYKMNITLDDIKEYDFTSVVKVSQAEFGKWFSTVEGTIYENSPLANGVRPILQKWNDNHKLYYISARGSHHYDLTKKWFSRNEIPYDRIELIGSHRKIEMIKQYEIDIFFEDKHDNAVAINEECKIPVILFNTPYNQEAIPDGVIRVNNWQEASAWVNKWMKE